MPSHHLRGATPADREFLFQVFAGTRADEMALTGWPQEMVEAFLRQQFEAQDRSYRQRFPAATFDLIVVDGQRAGRLYVDAGDDETRVIDLALLAPYRGRGVGTAVLGKVLAAAARRGTGVTLHVERNNLALRWYRRLGFQVAEDQGVYLQLRWQRASEVL